MYPYMSMSMLPHAQQHSPCSMVHAPARIRHDAALQHGTPCTSAPCTPMQGVHHAYSPNAGATRQLAVPLMVRAITPLLGTTQKIGVNRSARSTLHHNS